MRVALIMALIPIGEGRVFHLFGDQSVRVEVTRGRGCIGNRELLLRTYELLSSPREMDRVTGIFPS